MYLTKEQLKSIKILLLGSIITFVMFIIGDINEDMTSAYIWLAILTFICILSFNQNTYKQNTTT